jgi:WXG100 family type VII secretion target
VTVADVIQAQYEQLAEIASRFGQQSEVAEATSAQVRRVLDSLQNGGWIGQGADAFFAEMETLVMPGMQRLAEALAEARTVTLQIKDVLQQAEEEASSPFGGSAAPGLAGTTPGGIAGADAGVPGGVGPGGAAPGVTPPGAAPPGAGPARPSGPGLVESAQDWLADRPMIGFKLFGFGRGTTRIFTQGLQSLLLTTKTAANIYHAVPIAGGVIGTALNIMDANARGEDMDFAVGREIAVGTLKTEVALIPGLNLVAGGFELAHMFGLTDTNYTDTAVRAIAEPVHKYALDPASDLLAEGMYQVDQGVRAGYRGAKSVYNGAVDAFADGLDYVLPDWPW